MRPRLAAGLAVFTAVLHMSIASTNRCNRALYNERCGPVGITKAQCYEMHCCYSAQTPNDTSSIPGASCFYPINAEISSYAASMASHLEAVAFAGGSAAQKYTASQCKWGLPVLQPTNRSGDTWGLGWDNLLEVENIDMETADAMQGYDIVFYGDSISENWRGTSGGLHWKQWDGSLDKNFIAADMRSVFLNAFGYKYRAGVMAIAGDQIGHLWWRLQHGQLPQKPPKVAVILIGTNDLYAVSQCTHESESELTSSVTDIKSRFVDVLSVMKNAMPGTHIIIQGLLPRGADFGAGRYDYPNNYTAAVNILNAEYQRITLQDPYLHYIYCGAGFITDTADGIAPDVMPDGLHPNAAGLKLIAKCLTPLINRLIPSNSTQPSARNISTFGSVSQSRGSSVNTVMALDDQAYSAPGYVAAAAKASLQAQQAVP